jgi:hypothetical protein
MSAIATKSRAARDDRRVAHWPALVWRGCATCVLATALVLAATPAAAATPIFVRPGGSDTLCDGTVDADATSSGACAVQTIQKGVDLVDPGGQVFVAAGTYPEQVRITKNGLTVTGAGATIQPATAVSDTTQGSPCTNAVGTAIVLVSGVTGVTLNDLTVDGALLGVAIPPRFIGIYYRNASGAINGGSVLNISSSPLNGAQNGTGIEAQAKGPNAITVNVSGVTVRGYQKNGMTFNGCGDATTPDGHVGGIVSGNTVTGAGATPEIAENGIQVGFGAGPITITGNTITGDEYTGNPSNGTGAGILIFSSQNNTITLNEVSASNTGIALTSNVAETTGNTITCDRIIGDNMFPYDMGISADAAANTVQDNAIHGNAIGVDGTAIHAGSLNAENNWWGCPTGANTPGCDTATANVVFTPFRSTIPPCVSCTSNADCDDGLACTGTETCVAGSCMAGTPANCAPMADQCNDAACTEPSGTCQRTQKPNGVGCDDGNACTVNDTCQNGVCVGGAPVNCSPLADQCNDAACTEPSGACQRTPKADGVACDDGNACTTSDTCQNGVCRGIGGDADHDGYCDAVEVQAGCNPHDGREIPAQPNVYAGGWQKFGAILLAYRAPNRRHIVDGTDPSCTSAAGVCDPTTGFCQSGRVSDPCSTNAQCNLPANTCRVVINYAKTSDLRLLLAALQVHRQPSQDLMSLFSPATPGCSRKVDVLIPSGKRATLRLRASGTTHGRRWKCRNILQYRP